MATASVTGKIAPMDFKRFTGGHATDWTLITFDAWVRTIGVNNQGVASCWVSRALTGARAAADDQIEVKPGTTVDFHVGRPSLGVPKLAVFGSDGATHPIGFVLEDK
jgi:hypothetical protein